MTAVGDARKRAEEAGAPKCFTLDPDGVDNPLIPRQTAADTVLATARRLCCGDNPAPEHNATHDHSQRMAFAEELARAVRGS